MKKYGNKIICYSFKAIIIYWQIIIIGTWWFLEKELDLYKWLKNSLEMLVMKCGGDGVELIL
jgi:hypothetical protein